MAHNLNEVGDPRTIEGRQAVTNFLGRLIKDMELVMKVFGSLMVAYTEQNGYPSLPEDSGVREWLGDLLNVHDNTFFVKGSQDWKWKDE